MSIQFIKCIVFLNLATAYSFNLIEFKNIREEDVIKGLSKILKDYNKKNVRYQHENHIAVRGSRKNLHNNFEHTKLIKSIVPHGAEVKFNIKDATYIPLVRLHKKKPINKIYIKDNDEYISQGTLKAGEIKDAGETNADDEMPANHAQWWKKLKELKYKNKDYVFQSLKGIKSAKTMSDDDQKFVLRNEKQSNYFKHQNDKKRTEQHNMRRSNEIRRSPFHITISGNSKNYLPRNKTKLDEKLKKVKHKVENASKRVKNKIKEKKKPRNTFINYFVGKKDSLRNKNGRSDLNSIPLKKNWKADSEIEERWKNILAKRNRRGHKRSIYHTGRKHLKDSKSRDSKIVFLRTLLNNLVKPKLRFRSGEEDPTLHNIFDSARPSTQRPDRWLPKYSFWNYWAYDKELFQDTCEGNLIKMGQVCIEAPPH